jgi:sigma-B regulation protein RsbU (phosphoserine phosphatase)
MSCSLMRSFPGDGRDPVAVFQYLNAQLCKVSASRLVTALYAVYDGNKASLRLVRAGHLHPLLYRPASGVREIVCEGIFPMGMKSYVGEHIPVEEVKLQSGDQLLLFTDGIIERLNDQGEMYGVARLSAQLAAAEAGSPDDILQQIYADMDAFAGGRPADDDQTLLLALVD